MRAQHLETRLLAISELLRRLGNNEAAIALWACFGGRKQRTRPQKQSHDALSTSLSPGFYPNSEIHD